MFERIKKNILYSMQEETLDERRQRMLPGALYGVFAATVYILTLSSINVLTIPGMHLGIDWAHLLTYWIGFGFGLGISGLIVGWFSEDYAGVVSGGVVMTLLLLLGNLIISLLTGQNASLAFQSVVTAIPLVGGAVLLAAALRYVIRRHQKIAETQPAGQRRKLLAGLVGLVFVVSCLPGVFSRYDLSAVAVFKALNNSLQNGASDPHAAARFLDTQLPGLKSHFGAEYQVFPRISVFTAGALDITVRFEDGYSFTCVVPTDAGESTFFTTCNEGGSFGSK